MNCTAYVFNVFIHQLTHMTASEQAPAAHRAKSQPHPIGHDNVLALSSPANESIHLKEVQILKTWQHKREIYWGQNR